MAMPSHPRSQGVGIIIGMHIIWLQIKWKSAWIVIKKSMPAPHDSVGFVSRTGQFHITMLVPSRSWTNAYRFHIFLYTNELQWLRWFLNSWGCGTLDATAKVLNAIVANIYKCPCSSVQWFHERATSNHTLAASHWQRGTLGARLIWCWKCRTGQVQYSKESNRDNLQFQGNE